MKFKDYNDYMTQRNALMGEAKTLLDDGKIEEYNAKANEVKELDDAWDKQTKAMANYNALNNAPKPVNIMTANVNVPGGQPVASVNMGGAATETDVYDSMEYRKAFMNYVMNGAKIPANLQNTDASTKTGDVGSVIPTTIMQKIVEKMESTGMILPLVTKTSYPAGVTIPTSSVKPVASWVAEGTTSDKQKKPTGTITFTHFKLRCAVSMSLETSVMTLGIFETALINSVAEAMAKAPEQSILTGDGTTQPKGILTETVVEGQNVDIAASADPTYSTLTDAEAALPLAYESKAVWCMTKKTFMKFIGMVDSSKQPIARVNYGINGRPERTLLGRTVVLNDYMTSLGATITKDTVVAFLFNFEDYVLNTNYAVTVKRYEDNDTEDQVTKAIMLADGKVVDKNSLVTVTKKFTA
jgi:HK97 family phage major capsid protein